MTKLKKLIAWYFLPKPAFWENLDVQRGRVVETMGHFSRFRHDIRDYRRILEALRVASGPLLVKVKPHGIISSTRKKMVVDSVRVLEVVDTTEILTKFKHLCLINALKFVQGLYFQDKGKLALIKQRLLNLANRPATIANPAEDIRHLTAITAEIVASSLAMDVLQGLPSDLSESEREAQWTRAFAIAYDAINDAQMSFLVKMISQTVMREKNPGNSGVSLINDSGPEASPDPEPEDDPIEEPGSDSKPDSDEDSDSD